MGVALITIPEPVEAVGSVGRPLREVPIRMRYEVAPLTADQVKVGVVDTPLAPLEGELRVGGDNKVAVVVKERTLPWPQPTLL